MKGSAVRQVPAESCAGPNVFRAVGGAFSAPGLKGEIALHAGQCRDCKTRMFPARQRCVTCYGEIIDLVVLPRVGKLLTYTIVRLAPPGYMGPVPYVVGQVGIDNDITVLTPLVGKAPEAWRAGDAVASYALEIQGGAQDAAPAVCFSFKPASQQDLS